MSHVIRLISALGLLIGFIAYFEVTGVQAASAASPAPTVWGCFPGAASNPCESSLETTYLSSTTIQPRKVAKVETPPANPNPGVDCFYVYPTVVSTTLAANAPRHISNEVASILKFQAARFSSVCKVYAPIYRQATFAGLALDGVGTKKKDPTVAQPSKSFDLAYTDVVNAWHDYLASDNHGRGVVLIGHSQGSALLIRLMRDEIDQNPSERSRLVSAIVPGGNLTVKTGERTGGDLTTIPTCSTETELGCVMAWSTYAKQPSTNALFGRANSSLRISSGMANGADVEVACTNPAALSGDNGHDLALTPTAHFPGLIGLFLKIMYLGLTPTASTPWVSPGERYTASCVHSNGAHVLMVKRASWPTVLPLASPTPDWGLHLADLNLPMGNLIEIVAAESAAYLAAHPTATS